MYFTPPLNINVGLEAFFALNNIDTGGEVFQGPKLWKYQFVTNILSKIVVVYGEPVYPFTVEIYSNTRIPNYFSLVR